MNKYSGNIGFYTTVETEPGIWENKIITKRYLGNIINNRATFSSNNNSINDDIRVNSTISIVADSFLTDNFMYIKYIEYKKSKWKVSNYTIEYPRINLYLGGLYNEN